MTVAVTETLQTLEAYYDAAPRPFARSEEVGPFTVFVQQDPRGWPYYARPRLGRADADGPFTAYDVAAVRARQRELGVPESLEWVHETTPSLLDAVRGEDAPLAVHRCPLLVLDLGPAVQALPTPDGVAVELLTADSPRLPEVAAAIDAGFQGVDELVPSDVSRHRDAIRRGVSVIAGAYDVRGALGGGTHSPRGATTELQGIAVLPRARRRGIGAAVTHALVRDARARGLGTVFLSAQDDAVARVYARVGFRRVATACIAEVEPS